MSVKSGLSSEAITLLVNGAKAGDMNVRHLFSLLCLVRSEIKYNPAEYNSYTLGEKITLMNGTLDACNKVKAAYPQEFAEAFSREGKGSLQEYKGIIDSHVHELMEEIRDNCSITAIFSLLNSANKPVDKGIASHVASFIHTQDIFSVFLVDQSTYAPFQAYIGSNVDNLVEQLVGLVIAGDQDSIVSD